MMVGNSQNIYSFLAAYHAVSLLTSGEITLIYALILLPGRLMKKAESLYYRPSLFQSDNTNLELFKDETAGITAEDAFLEMKRTDALIRVSSVC